jgi:hypothetical protein
MGNEPSIVEVTDEKEILLQRPERVLKESSPFQLHGNFDQRHDDGDQREADVCPLLQERLDEFVVNETQHRMEWMKSEILNTKPQTTIETLNAKHQTTNKRFGLRIWSLGFVPLFGFRLRAGFKERNLRFRI